MQIIISTILKEPIYEQIHVQIMIQILTNELQAGEVLPSMRQLAKDLDISVIQQNEPMKNSRKMFLFSIVGKGSFDLLQECCPFSYNRVGGSD
ncbi:GntR family transcriptional regulator [Niallia circulans]|nr:GntR family transcriptional regulator [Niallia circulans]